MVKRALLEARLAELGIDAVFLEHPESRRDEDHPSSEPTSGVAADSRNSLPIIVHAPSPRIRLVDWIVENKPWIHDNLKKSGALLFRGFRIDGPEGFENCLESAYGKPTDYPGLTHGVILRQHIHGKIYTSTEYSPSFRIRLHNECAFANNWPAQISFFCVEAPSAGGETPIADSRRVLKRISKTTVERLAKHGIQYVRNFGYGSSRSWEKTFGTTDKSKVEAICRADGVICDWLDQSRLRTRSVRQPVVNHPITGEAVWFNHINSSHIFSLEPELRDALLSEFEKEDLPRNCYYGDGSEIERTVLDEIQQAYEAETVAFTWQTNDLLMLDNMLVAHGRNTFEGPRKIVVGMTGSINRDDLQRVSNRQL